MGLRHKKQRQRLQSGTPPDSRKSPKDSCKFWRPRTRLSVCPVTPSLLCCISGQADAGSLSRVHVHQAERGRRRRRQEALCRRSSSSCSRSVMQGLRKPVRPAFCIVATLSRTTHSDVRPLQRGDQACSDSQYRYIGHDGSGTSILPITHRTSLQGSDRQTATPRY